MSVIAVKIDGDTIHIAADNADVWGDTVTQTGDKLWHIGGYYSGRVLGAVGSSAVGLLMKHFLTHVDNTRLNTEAGWLDTALRFRQHCAGYGLNADDASFIVVENGKVWRLSGVHVTQVITHEAIGAGRPYALAALHLDHDVTDAVGVACDLNKQCARPIVTMSMRTR
jgi:ATP-dependent protease HslVU (ClpYQ) peptidase subunit